MKWEACFAFLDEAVVACLDGGAGAEVLVGGEEEGSGLKG